MSNKIILVTGANRGLGYSVLQVAGGRDPSNTYILGSRDLEAGKKAKEQLEQEGVKANIEVLKLDVTNDDEIMEAVKFVAVKYGKLDVLVNNAGIISIIPDYSLPSLRRCCNEMFNVNMASVAVVTSGFTQLLQKAPKPRVINVTSGLGSIENTLNTQMTRYAPYGISKVGLNGITAHMQAMEIDRAAKSGGPDSTPGYIRYFSVAPGLLKTAFNNYLEAGLDPKIGAEVIVQLIADDEGKYKGGSQLEYVDGKVKTIPW
ncbi:NAD(P)-binding protein [Trichoderma velutinum]